MIALVEHLSLVWLAVAAIMLVRSRHEIKRSLMSLHPAWRVALGLLLVGCAFVPGPVDELIVLAIIRRLGRRQPC